MPTDPTALTNNYLANQNHVNDQDSFDIRLDHRFSDQDQIFALLQFRRRAQPATGPAGAALGRIRLLPQHQQLACATLWYWASRIRFHRKAAERSSWRILPLCGQRVCPLISEIPLVPMNWEFPMPTAARVPNSTWPDQYRYRRVHAVRRLGVPPRACIREHLSNRGHAHLDARAGTR